MLRFAKRFTPTSASRLNVVERFFRAISENRIKHDRFASMAELEKAIAQYIEHHNNHPKPFIWTARADDILAKAPGQAHFGSFMADCRTIECPVAELDAAAPVETDGVNRSIAQQHQGLRLNFDPRIVRLRR